MNTTPAFREQVRRDALAAGNPPAVAAFLAKNVGKPVPAEIAETMRSNSRAARLPTMRAAAGTTALDRIAALYGAAALVPDLQRANVPLRTVAHWLADATGTARAISPAGVQRVRIRLMSQGAAS